MTDITSNIATHANKLSYTDVDPFEIVRKVSAKTLEIRAMDAIRDFTPNIIPGGFSGHCLNNTEAEQNWIITSNPNNSIKRIRLGKYGWKDKHGNRYELSDKPRKFYDYNF